MIRCPLSSSSHCRFQEFTDTLALSIDRQIHGPKLEDTSSVLLLVCSASSSSAGGKRREWGRGLLGFSGWGWSWRTGAYPSSPALDSSCSVHSS
jgi:hypothetical protein